MPGIGGYGPGAQGLLDLVLAHADATGLFILNDREATGGLSRHRTEGVPVINSQWECPWRY
jgi:hypothetical protein